MKSLINLLVFFGLLSGMYFQANAQQKEKTLLWRISGNGLQQSSYLFGTVHLKAKKLFNFPDSLYAAIDNTEVFALEVNPDSMNNMVSAYANKLLNKKEDTKDNKKKEKTLREILTPAELKTLRESLSADSDIDPDELTVKQAYLMKDKLLTQKPRKDDLPTFMDAFLYSIAKDKGKAVAGVEHIEDQLNLLETMDFSDADPKKIATYVSNGSSVQDKMIQVYISKDLEELQKISDIIPKKQADLLLTARNKNMLRSMDSIMRLHSLFCAVGALHLPGKQGLITLLRGKGYTVTPVISEDFINGADYTFKTGGSNWVNITSAQDGYTIKMPGQPNEVNTGSGTVVMKLYYDLGTSMCYVTNHTNIPQSTSISEDELMDAAAAKMTIDGKKIGHKDITVGELKGREYSFTGKSEIKYRVQMLANKTDMYMLMAYSQAALKNTDSFFRSFRLITKMSSANKATAFDDILLSVSLPDNKPTRDVSYSQDSADKQTMYTIVDPTIGNYYFIVCSEPKIGYNYNNDTVFLSNVKTYLDSKNITATIENNRYRGYKCYDYVTSAFSGMKIKGKLLFCGNRQYSILAQAPDNEQGLAAADSFLQSIRIKTAYPDAIHKEVSDNEQFSCFVPSPLIRKTIETDNDDTTQPSAATYKSYDQITLMTYLISSQQINPYYWKTDDTTMLKTLLDQSKVKSDSTPVYSYSSANGLPNGELITYKKYSEKIHRVKVIADGRTLYTLDCTYPISLKDNKRIDSFYSTFRVLKKDKQALQTSPDLLLTDLHSKDSLTRTCALKALSEVTFTKADAQALIRAVITEHPADTSNPFATVTTFRLFNILKEFGSDIPMQQLEQLYQHPMVVDRGQQFQVLNMMAMQKDSIATYAKVKELLLKSPPTKGGAYAVTARFNQHPQLSKTLFPELLQQCADSVMGYMVCNLACRLIDSSYLLKKDLERYIPLIITKSKELRNNKSHWASSTVVDLLSHLGTKEAMDEIKQYQYSFENYLRYAAIEVLVDSQQRPDPGALDSIASDKYYRLRLYHLLNDKNVAGYYPAKYLTQQYFAESYMSEVDDDDYYGNITYVGMRTELYKGQKQKFYLYKAEYTDGDSTTYYMGVAGPFNNDPKQVTIDYDESACGFSADPLDMKQLDNQLKVYLIKKKINDSRQE